MFVNFFTNSGYMAPEYAMDGQFSEKSDVFSFGIILLELISGRKNVALCDPNQSQNLVINVSWISRPSQIYFFISWPGHLEMNVSCWSFRLGSCGKKAKAWSLWIQHCLLVAKMRSLDLLYWASCVFKEALQIDPPWLNLFLLSRLM